jgi:hypothetical protein
MTVHAPQITHVERVSINSLRPTQLTVGYREVAAKRAEWRAMPKAGRKHYIDGHVVPTVLGPKQRIYVVDHHHLARALVDEGRDDVLAGHLADLSALEKDEFWSVMSHRNWVYPFDADGRRQDFAAIPKSVEALTDDPWRSLSGALRDAGGYAKQGAPFTEFRWADFLRRRIDASLLAADFDAALGKARALAHQRAAAHLPGWTAA